MKICNLLFIQQITVLIKQKLRKIPGITTIFHSISHIWYTQTRHRWSNTLLSESGYSRRRSQVTA